jgi:Uma2 family endonuclease
LIPQQDFPFPTKPIALLMLSWVKKSRWSALTPEQREKFIPLCPDLVIELVSPSDSLKKESGKNARIYGKWLRFGLAD